MSRYILIDNYTGYIWGDSADFDGHIFSGSAIDFARALDLSNKVASREYTMQPSAAPGDSGYHVYRDDTDAVLVVWDGQDSDTIDSVKASCLFEGFIRTTPSRD